jgi:Fe2+ or Zn2+ uptake regulation protein
MHDNETHPTAEALFVLACEKMPGISLRTVYQTLHELAEMGELQFIEIGPGATRFDPNVSDLHDAVCDECGQIRDVHVTGAETLWPVDPTDFVINEVGVVFRGLCLNCNTNRRKKVLTRGVKSPVHQAKASKK